MLSGTGMHAFHCSCSNSARLEIDTGLRACDFSVILVNFQPYYFGCLALFQLNSVHGDNIMLCRVCVENKDCSDPGSNLNLSLVAQSC